tara:strand:- start:48 stop:650 length:603 start_codon:yes stop_codon:yes gene_type:complete
MIHICNDFFSDPYHVRSIALRQKYKTEKFNYPGVRSFNVPAGIGEYILSYVRHITKDPSLIIANQSFQSVTKEFSDGIYHQDREYDYLCIIYLSLDPPPNSGTEVCDSDHPSDSFPNIGHIADAFHADPHNLITRYRYARIRRKLNSHYKPIMTAPNKFNRILIFNSHNFHRAQNFFGTSLGDSRLTLVTFLDSPEKQIR